MNKSICGKRTLNFRFGRKHKGKVHPAENDEFRIFQRLKQRKKKIKENRDSLRKLWDTMTRNNICIMKIPER